MPRLAYQYSDAKGYKVHLSFQKDSGQTGFVFEYVSHFRGICMYYVWQWTENLHTSLQFIFEAL